MTMAQLFSIITTPPEGKVGKRSVEEALARRRSMKKAKAAWIKREVNRYG